MRRRELLFFMPCVVLRPTGAFAQSPQKTYRVGFLGATSRSIPAIAGYWAALEEALRELGYVQGRNLVVEYRGADGRQERLPGLARELVALNVDLIVAGTDTAALAAMSVTRTIPIVFVAAGDPVGVGLVASLARPGGNVTGLASFTDTVIGKQLELLAEVLPHIGSLAVIYSSSAAASALQLAATKDAISRFKMNARLHDLPSGRELEDVLRTIGQERPQALLVLPSVVTFLHRVRIAEFAAEKGIPTVHGLAAYVEAGGLMSYSFSYIANFRGGARYVDRILRGANPAELPVEQPTKFETIVNLRTARRIGLAIPRQVLLRADRVIE
jgi:putative ABC transport system substrate-binding protein